MAVFEYPVPYTATLSFNGKQRKFNVLGSLTVDLEELSTEDLTHVATWNACKYPDGTPLGQAGECYWHKGRFMSPILFAADGSADFVSLRPADVHRVMMTRDRVITFDDVFFHSFKPSGYEHDLFKETFAEDGWRPGNLPRGDDIEDTFALKASSARKLLNDLVLVDGTLFHVTSEPVLGCIFSSDTKRVSIHIRTAEKFHEDWEIFRLDRLDDAIAYANDRWPDVPVEVMGSAPILHDESHLDFDDEAYSLTASARSLIDETLGGLHNLSKETGMAIVRLNRIVPVFDDGPPEVLNADILEEIASSLPAIRPALKSYDLPRLDSGIARWELRPSQPTYGFR